MPAAKKVNALPVRLWVNGAAGFAEVKFVGSLTRGALEHRVRQWQIEVFRRAPDSFLPAQKALWRYSFDCNYRKDSYELRLQLRSARAFEAAAEAYDREIRALSAKPARSV